MPILKQSTTHEKIPYLTPAHTASLFQSNVKIERKTRNILLVLQIVKLMKNTQINRNL
jgi:hypothetical protein